ncbi:TnpA family transposase [Streptomyces sp. V1I1]|nr:TnpA family transposase [Streptomyces sp. V1I1]
MAGIGQMVVPGTPRDSLRMFGREGHPTPLGQAFAEYGRIAKALGLLAVVDPVDDTYRRPMHKQPTVQESRHKLARDICHGKKRLQAQVLQSSETE